MKIWYRRNCGGWCMVVVPPTIPRFFIIITHHLHHLLLKSRLGAGGLSRTQAMLTVESALDAAAEEDLFQVTQLVVREKELGGIDHACAEGLVNLQVRAFILGIAP